MKSFFVAAAGAALANAACSFVEGAGKNGATGQMVCLSDKKTVEVLNNVTTDKVKWTIDSWTVMYMDSGEQFIRLQHNLTADIFATDVVLFELSYRPKLLPAPTDKATIGEDYVQCEMQRSSTDKQYWTAAVSEGYYICKGPTASNVCLGITDDTQYTP